MYITECTVTALDPGAKPRSTCRGTQSLPSSSSPKQKL